LLHVSENDAEAVLASCLALFSENDGRLARVIRGWNDLPEENRLAILGLAGR
jgi:hypothetical protein